MPTTSPAADPFIQIPADFRLLLTRLNEPAAALAGGLDLMFRQLAAVMQQTQRDDAAPARLAARSARQVLAEALLAMSDDRLEPIYAAGLGRIHMLLARAELKLEEPLEEERALIDQVREFIDPASTLNLADAGGPRRLLVAMLYFLPDELTTPFNIPAVPAWMMAGYLGYLHEQPPLFNALGASERYGQFVRRWVGYVYVNALANPDSTLWRQVTGYFVQAANFIPLYFNAMDLHDIHQQRGEVIERVLKQAGFVIDYTFPPRAASRKRIKVGILNGHFCSQTETFHTIPAFEHLDRENFEVVLYALNRGGDAIEDYCRAHAERFVELPRDLAAQVAALRAEDLDAIITGSNVTAVTNQILLLMTHRIARLQCTLFGSPTSTGLRNMDVYISGALSEPEQGAESHYREKLVKLDGPGFCFTYPPVPAQPLPLVTREALGIPAEALVFASGANFYKITPELEAVWLKVLAAVPGSVLLLYPFSPSWSNAYPVNTFMRRMATDMAALNLDVSRLVVLPGLNGREEVKSYLRVADVYLDSFPHSGSHSLYDPLELGIPAVAMDGGNLRAKHGGAMLRDLGLEEWVARDESSYVDAARRLGTDASLRAGLRERIQTGLARPARFIDARFYSGQIGKTLEALVGT